MTKFFLKLINSFDTYSPAFSGRKLTAFALLLLAAYCHRFVSETNVEGVLMIDLGACLICLVLVTAQQLVGLRTGTVIESTKVEETVKVETNGQP